MSEDRAVHRAIEFLVYSYLPAVGTLGGTVLPPFELQAGGSIMEPADQTSQRAAAMDA